MVNGANLRDVILGAISGFIPWFCAFAFMFNFPATLMNVISISVISLGFALASSFVFCLRIPVHPSSFFAGFVTPFALAGIASGENGIRSASFAFWMLLSVIAVVSALIGFAAAAAKQRRSKFIRYNQP